MLFVVFDLRFSFDLLETKLCPVINFQQLPQSLGRPFHHHHSDLVLVVAKRSTLGDLPFVDSTGLINQRRRREHSSSHTANSRAQARRHPTGRRHQRPVSAPAKTVSSTHSSKHNCFLPSTNTKPSDFLFTPTRLPNESPPRLHRRHYSLLNRPAKVHDKLLLPCHRQLVRHKTPVPDVDRVDA